MFITAVPITKLFAGGGRGVQGLKEGPESWEMSSNRPPERCLLQHFNTEKRMRFQKHAFSKINTLKVKLILRHKEVDLATQGVYLSGIFTITF